MPTAKQWAASAFRKIECASSIGPFLVGYDSATDEMRVIKASTDVARKYATRRPNYIVGYYTDSVIPQQIEDDLVACGCAAE